MNPHNYQHLAQDGYEIIDHETVPLLSTDEYNILNCMGGVQQPWTRINPDYLHPSSWSPNQRYIVRRRKPTTEERLTGLETSVKELLRRTEPTKACEAKACEPVFMVGDYIVSEGHLPALKGQVLVVESGGVGWVNHSQGGGMTRFYRRATREEITTHLLIEAAKQGFKVGAKVVTSNYLHETHTIRQMGVWHPGDPSFYPCVQTSYISEEERLGRPFVHINDGSFHVPLSKLILFKEEPITIEVDGETNIAKFNEDYVRFSFDEISNDTFRRAKAYLNVESNCHREINLDLRLPDAIRIGKGLFTRELINRICERLDDPQ